MVRFATVNKFVGLLFFIAAPAVPRTAAIPQSTTSTTPSPSCMHSGCDWPYTFDPNYSIYDCYAIDPNSCTFNDNEKMHLEMKKDVVFLPVPGRIHGYNETDNTKYIDNHACIWRFPPLDSCSEYELKVFKLDLTVTGGEECQCEDHIELEYKGQSSITQKTCMNVLKLPTGISARSYVSLGNFTLKFRTDASGSARGYYIIIYIRNNPDAPGDCAKTMAEPQHTNLDILMIPSIPRCPPFSFLIVKKELSKAIKNIMEKGDSKESLAPPLPQCYCYGTCTAETENDRTAAIGELLPRQSFTAYLNSPDSILRKIARAAKQLDDKRNEETSG